MISASEAREQSTNSISGQTEVELLVVEKKIKEAISKGETSCWCYTYLHEQTLSKLRMLGYGVVNQSSQKDGTMFKIVWK